MQPIPSVLLQLFPSAALYTVVKNTDTSSSKYCNTCMIDNQKAKIEFCGKYTQKHAPLQVIDSQKARIELCGKYTQ